MSPGRRRLLGAALAGLGLLVVAVAVWWTSRPVSLDRPVHRVGAPLATTSPSPPSAATPDRALPTPVSTVAPSPAAAPTVATTVPAAPDHLAGATMVVQIQALGVDAPVVPVTTSPDGVLDPPGDVHTLGWWDPGAYPGAADGSSVIVGHVNSVSQGDGALYDLGDLPLGAPIVVTDSSGTHTFHTTSVQQATKGTLPASLFATTGAPQLVLITCGGPFDSHTGHYLDNVVAVATPS